jgi:hypothetical protein
VQQGTAADGGQQASQLSHPAAFAIDESGATQNLLVADRMNHRVVAVKGHGQHLYTCGAGKFLDACSHAGAPGGAVAMNRPAAAGAASSSGDALTDGGGGSLDEPSGIAVGG